MVNPVVCESSCESSYESCYESSHESCYESCDESFYESSSEAEDETDSIRLSGSSSNSNSESSSEAEDDLDSICLSDSSSNSNSEDGEDFEFINLFSDSEDEVDFINMPWDGTNSSNNNNNLVDDDPWMLLEAGELREVKDQDPETFLWVRYITTSWTPTSAALIQCIKQVPPK